MAYLFVAMTILLTVYGQFVIKWQVAKSGPLPANLADGVGYLVALLLNPWILSGLGAAFGAAVCWMLALSKLPLSHAYPYMAGQFVVVVVGSAWLFSEPLTVPRIVGVVLIGIGVIVSGLG